MSADKPPTSRYTYTLIVTGNSHDEIEHEVLMQTRGGYLIDSDSYERDEFEVVGGRSTRRLVHVNPEMTPERYERELDEWWQARKQARKADR